MPIGPHLRGVFAAHLAELLLGLAVYCVLVLGAIPWIGRVYLRKHGNDEAVQFVAAVVTQLTARYTWNEGLGMWSLSLPQLAATLAAALTAFQTHNAAGERLIDETVMSAVIVLMVMTATLGPILTQRFAQRIARHS